MPLPARGYPRPRYLLICRALSRGVAAAFAPVPKAALRLLGALHLPAWFAISVIGVLIFAGLTAYDTQKIKNTYLTMRTTPGGEAYLEKGAVMGALKLYLDFLNMFMFLLHLLGNRN